MDQNQRQTFLRGKGRSRTIVQNNGSNDLNQPSYGFNHTGNTRLVTGQQFSPTSTAVLSNCWDKVNAKKNSKNGISQFIIILC